MSRNCTIAILSDVHYAGAAEQARGNNFEFDAIANPVLRHLVKAFRRFIWLRHPLKRNYLLDNFLAAVGPVDHVIAVGDYAYNAMSVGVSDDATFLSAQECLAKLRQEFGPNFHAVFGDHEMGKRSMAGGLGGMRLASWHRARRELGLEAFWQFELGNFVLMGVASSLVALPVFEAETLPAERPDWEQLREQHLTEIRQAFTSLKTAQRVLLFCHDPTALPFLWREETVRGKVPQVEQTIIGHFHSNLVLWESRLLAGMPRIGFLGHTPQRMTTALREARHWKPFKVRLCPALAGIELLKDGGYLTLELDPEARLPLRFQFHRLRR